MLRQLVTLFVILSVLHLGRLEQIEDDGEINLSCVCILVFLVFMSPCRRAELWLHACWFWTNTTIPWSITQAHAHNLCTCTHTHMHSYLINWKYKVTFLIIIYLSRNLTYAWEFLGFVILYYKEDWHPLATSRCTQDLWERQQISLQLPNYHCRSEVGNAEAVGDTACNLLCLTLWKTGADWGWWWDKLLVYVWEHVIM